MREKEKYESYGTCLLRGNSSLLLTAGQSSWDLLLAVYVEGKNQPCDLICKRVSTTSAVQFQETKMLHFDGVNDEAKPTNLTLRSGQKVVIRLSAPDAAVHLIFGSTSHNQLVIENESTKYLCSDQETKVKDALKKGKGDVFTKLMEWLKRQQSSVHKSSGYFETPGFTLPKMVGDVMKDHVNERSLAHDVFNFMKHIDNELSSERKLLLVEGQILLMVIRHFPEYLEIITSISLIMKNPITFLALLTHANGCDTSLFNRAFEITGREEKDAIWEILKFVVERKSPVSESTVTKLFTQIVPLSRLKRVLGANKVFGESKLRDAMNSLLCQKLPEDVENALYKLERVEVEAKAEEVVEEKRKVPVVKVTLIIIAMIALCLFVTHILVKHI